MLKQIFSSQISSSDLSELRNLMQTFQINVLTCASGSSFKIQSCFYYTHDLVMKGNFSIFTKNLLLRNKHSSAVSSFLFF